jgi:hypothetical protein
MHNLSCSFNMSSSYIAQFFQTKNQKKKTQVCHKNKGLEGRHVSYRRRRPRRACRAARARAPRGTCSTPMTWCMRGPSRRTAARPPCWDQRLLAAIVGKAEPAGGRRTCAPVTTDQAQEPRHQELGAPVVVTITVAGPTPKRCPGVTVCSGMQGTIELFARHVSGGHQAQEPRLRLRHVRGEVHSCGLQETKFCDTWSPRKINFSSIVQGSCTFCNGLQGIPSLS